MNSSEVEVFFLCVFLNDSHEDFKGFIRCFFSVWKKHLVTHNWCSTWVKILNSPRDGMALSGPKFVQLHRRSWVELYKWNHYMGVFLKWWYPHFTPQVLIIFSRKTHGCWVPPFRKPPYITNYFYWMFGETTISQVKVWNHPTETLNVSGTRIVQGSVKITRFAGIEQFIYINVFWGISS